jgi:hypothetical protein
MTEKDEKDEKEKLELRRVKALEKIANSLDALTIWFEDIDKKEWSERIQYYLSEWHRFKKIETNGELLND